MHQRKETASGVQIDICYRGKSLLHKGSGIVVDAPAAHFDGFKSVGAGTTDCIEVTIAYPGIIPKDPTKRTERYTLARNVCSRVRRNLE